MGFHFSPPEDRALLRFWRRKDFVFGVHPYDAVCAIRFAGPLAIFEGACGNFPPIGHETDEAIAQRLRALDRGLTHYEWERPGERHHEKFRRPL